MKKPIENHFMAAKRIMRYLRDTTNVGILHRRDGKSSLEAFCDSVYVGITMTERVHEGARFLTMYFCYHFLINLVFDICSYS